MPPQQPYYQPPQGPSSELPQPNYDFIMNPEKPKRQMNGFFDGSPKSLFIMLGVGAVILIVLFIAYQAMKPASIVPQLGELAKSQAQMVHLSSLAGDSTNGANSQATKNLAANIGIVAASQQNELVALLAQGGDKLPATDLVVSTSEADALLQQASQNSEFDSTFKQIATTRLESYQSQLTKIFKSAKSKSLKLQLQADYEAAGLLLEQTK